MIRLHVEPRLSKTWAEFLVENPPYSIALDGYVRDAPRYSPAGPHANFDHHAGVDRLSTRSTCMQVFMAMTLGFFDAYMRDGEPHAHVWVNDPDQDTCLAVWQLLNPELIRNMSVSRPLGRLLITEDILDCTGGAYPANPDSEEMRQQAWVFEPYFEARKAGELAMMDAEEMEAVIVAVCGRISAHTTGEGKEITLDTAYDEIGGGPGWMLMVERGQHARTELFGEGVRAFISVRDNGDGSWTYSIGRMSPFVRFPLEELYELLTAAEQLPPDAPGWGGSNTIGGSPREGGSRLPPAEVERLVNEHLARSP